MRLLQNINAAVVFDPNAKHDLAEFKFIAHIKKLETTLDSQRLGLFVFICFEGYL